MDDLEKVLIEAEEAPSAEPPPARIPAAAEALGYVGGALALAAVVTLLATFWNDLGTMGRAGIPAALALVAMAAGMVLERLGDAASGRLGRFLLAVGTVSAGGAVGFLVRDAHVSKASDWAWFSGMAAIAVIGGVVWSRRRVWMQHLVFGVGVGLAALFVLPLVPIDGPSWGAGAVLAFVGVVWGALALRDVLEPVDAAVALSSLGILGGVELMAMSHLEGGVILWPLWLGLIAAIGLVAGGALGRRYFAVGAGAIGIVLFAIELFNEILGTGVWLPATLLGVGIFLLGASSYLTLSWAAAEKTAGRIVAEIGGYLGAAFLAAGCGTLISIYWDKIGAAGRVSVPLLAAVVGYAAGLTVERAKSDSARRMSQVLLSAGAFALALAAGMGVREMLVGRMDPIVGEQYRSFRDPSNWALLAGASTAVVTAGLTWFARKGALPLLLTGFASFMVVTATQGLLGVERLAWWAPGVAVIALAVLWLALGLREIVKPANSALVVGATLAIFGPMMLQMDESGNAQSWAMLLGLAVSLAGIAASIPLRRGVLLGFGSAGVVLFSFTTVQLFFRGESAAVIALLVAGVVFIVLAVFVARTLPKLRGGGGGRHLPAV